MERRKFFAGALVAPVAGTVLAQQRPVAEMPKLETALPGDVGVFAPRFLAPAQFATLGRLAEVLMPTPEAGVGAREAKAAEFLDFYLGLALPDRQQVYLKGLDALEAVAKKKYQKSYEAVSVEQANELLAPLKQPWSPEPPADALTRFLQVAKADVRTATLNSKEFNASNVGGARRPGGVGLYWKRLD